jgi:serine O-acetyltransferase
MNGDGGTKRDEDTDIDALVGAMLSSYRADIRGQYIGRKFLPSRDEIVDLVGLFLQMFFPGYHGKQNLTDANIEDHLREVASTLREKLSRQIEMCLCHLAECEQKVTGCSSEARRIARELLRELPSLRSAVIEDVQAAYDGDPAATNLHEIILSYPGLMAVVVYRVAHELHAMGVPLLPRIMTEWAHSTTGADIHPGARIGKSFFIDHATGVVVGETSDIGDNVKLYQGVTLGALSHPRDEQGRVIRNTKRHPTVEDSVTIYANATVLGGETSVGRSSIIGGSVFLTRSVPERARVALKPAELTVRTTNVPPPHGEEPWSDFEI